MAQREERYADCDDCGERYHGEEDISKYTREVCDEGADERKTLCVDCLRGWVLAEWAREVKAEVSQQIEPLSDVGPDYWKNEAGEWCCRNNSFFKTLTADEDKEFRQWARDSWRPGDPISPMWHPVVRDECRTMTEEARRVGASDNNDNNEGSRA